MSATYPRAVRRVDRVGPADAAPRRRTVVRLWLPLTPLFLLLAPFALLLAPLGYLVPPKLRPDPFFAVFALGELLLALGGTDLLIDTPDAYVRLKIL
jgi:hypothetical protein